MLSLPFTFVGMILAWTLIARGLQRRLIPLVAATLTLNLALNLALVPAYSYKASAAATLTTEASARSSRFFVGAGCTSARARSVPGSASGSLALGAGAPSSVARFGDIVGTAVTVVVFAALVVALGLVTRDEVNALIRRRTPAS